MSSILTGVFSNNNHYKNLEKDLEASGISNSEYIVYLNNNNEDHFLTSVQVTDNQHAEEVQQLFNKNNVNRSFLFNDMTIKEAESYDDIQNRIKVLVNNEIPITPGSNVKDIHIGMDSKGTL